MTRDNMPKPRNTITPIVSPATREPAIVTFLAGVVCGALGAGFGLFVWFT